jgi:dephospho-CoA kinase
MKRFGLTGGIASGKSTVAVMLRDLGFPVLDADSLAHQFLEPGHAAYDAVVREFGPGILDSSNRINRAALAAIVFADRDKLARLNSIIHPLVEQAMLQQFNEWERSGAHSAAFVEAALLVEAGFQHRLDGLLVAWCTPHQQIERLLARGFPEAEARRRIATQLPVEEKLRYATVRIDCSGSLEKTRAQVETFAESLAHA